MLLVFSNYLLLNSSKKTKYLYTSHAILYYKKGDKMTLSELIQEEKPSQEALEKAEEKAFEEYYN